MEADQGTSGADEVHAYEYHLTHWGQVMNTDQRWLEKELGVTATDHWFQTAEKRAEFKKKLKTCAARHNCVIAFAEHEGRHVRLRTVAHMTMRLHDGRAFDYADDLGYAYAPGSARYMWHDGNHGCDCNRSLLLGRAGHDVEEMECGDTIKLENFRVTQEP